MLLHVNFSLNQILLTFLLYVGQIWMTQLILLLIYMVLQFMWKKGLPFACNLSLEKSVDSNLCFRLALLHSVSYFFFLYRSPCLSLCTVFDSISSNVDEVLLINPSANVFVFGTFKVHHQDLLTYSSGTDTLSDLKWPYSDSWLSHSDPWLWLSQSCSFGFIYFFWG